MCAALLAFGVTAAHAELNFSTTFGSAGTGDGQFAGPQGIGVDQTTLDLTSGDVYVADTANARVEQFDSAGKFIRTWGWGVADGASAFEVCTSACRAGIPGTGAGQFSSPTSVAVDSSSDSSQGDIYVGDSTNNVVDKFSPSGALLATITGPSPSTFSSVTGVAVDGNGDLWVVDGSAGVVSEFDSDGALLSQFADGYGYTREVAADTVGNVYLINGGGVTERWTPAARAAGPGNGVEVDSQSGTGLAVDLSTDDLYVDLGGSVEELEADGRSLGDYGSGLLSQGAQMAYDPSVTLPGAGGPGALYVADQSGDDVAVFVPPGPAAPTVLPNSESATSITATAAALHATVDANGLDTKYFFEYGPTTAYGTQIPLPPGTDIGANYPPASAGVELSGLTASTAYHFRVVASNSLGKTYGPDATFTTATPLAPAVEGETTANITPTKATLQATVNPEFADTHYIFEYGPTTGYSTQVPLPPGTDIGAAASGQGASVELSELAASTTYHFRVVATNSVGTTYGPDAQFTTSPPVLIDAAFVTDVTASSAELEARIDPEGVDTHYRFEYGPTPSYGASLPTPEGDLGSGEGEQGVAVRVPGLQPSTKYYFRVVATNALGSGAASAQTFTTYPAGEEPSVLPDGRAYELVSPPDKNGGNVGGEGLSGVFVSGLGQSSVSGSAITYATYTSFGDDQSGPIASQYISLRGPSGWRTHAITPPTVLSENLRISIENFHIFTPELTAAVIDWTLPALTAGAPQKFDNLYVENLGADEAPPTYQLLTTVTPPNQTPEGFGVRFEGASADLSHVVFDANDALAPGAPANAWSVYESTGGAVRLVSVLPGPGNVAAESAGAGDGDTESEYFSPGAVSADGSRIFWTDNNGQLYVREDGVKTVQLNISQRTPSLGDGSATFCAATPDGARVFFTDSTPLTNNPDDNGGLYEYDLDSGTLTDLTPEAGGSPGVEGLLGISEDGASVYFVASADLAGQASAGMPNLYLARGGAITFIATLSTEDSDDWTQDFKERTAEVVPDGGYVVFESRASLTGYDNTDVDTGGADAEVFVYDAATKRLSCASCNPSGERPIGPSTVPTARLRVHQPRYISEDGQQVFFDSGDALLPAATNGKQDVYEYENGTVHLISSGTSDDVSALADTSPNGDNVFFTTRAQLVPEDQDENADMYDARVDGGFPVVVAPVPCTGEECRAAPAAPPAPVDIATEVSGGAPEGAPLVAQTGSPRPATRSHRHRTARARSGGRRSARRSRTDRPSRRRRSRGTARRVGRRGRRS
jgi:hypothetical protein